MRQARRPWTWLALIVLGLLGVLSLACCSGLPTLTPELSRRARPPPQVNGPTGPLSAAQAKAVLLRLSGQGQQTGIFERHLALEEAITGSPLSAGNSVQLLQDGPATYRAMFAAILAAQDHINMETYILDDDEVGQRFAQALIAKQAEGVQVNLLHDSAGTMATPSAFFERLSAAGIQVLEFNPLNPIDALGSNGEWALNQRDHRKLLVVDGRIAFLGGINISSVYSGGSFKSGSRAVKKANAKTGLAWRDTDLQLQGPVVADLQRLFMASWAAQNGPALAGKKYFPALPAMGREVVRAIGSSPDEPFSLIYATLLSAIASAETTVHLSNAYFVPDPQLLKALSDAAERGVDVKLILPGQTDSWLVLQAGHASYAPLLRAGVKIFERQGAIMHAKTASIDGVWSSIGSTNLDWRSFLHNQELNAVVLGADFGGQMRKQFDRDLLASTQISWALWQQRPWSTRLQEWFANVWAYWL
ncbi:phospholipase D-like domain-containing protein [Paucibacter sp. TC2R-5]|uniref:phospholipase D-like domain-containing protein n=1 Tax=Paucibacter sp. TC2R-5 TaxID=2893555 RepID=UPI0021E4971A|nr:phospholipase D-like domain-containing protein [Paucibacter sp. TC2R-5]MCV2360597.1 phospholipase D-like domain-containing protein [Paucibacter sp. TC2R-5]